MANTRPPTSDIFEYALNELAAEGVTTSRETLEAYGDWMLPLLAKLKSHVPSIAEFLPTTPGQCISFCLDDAEGWDKLKKFIRERPDRKEVQSA